MKQLFFLLPKMILTAKPQALDLLSLMISLQRHKMIPLELPTCWKNCVPGQPVHVSCVLFCVSKIPFIFSEHQWLDDERCPSHLEAGYSNSYMQRIDFAELDGFCYQSRN